MGLLDDAIREHLDLKRQHGAAEEELRRKESEALGPARRDFAPAEETAVAEPEPAPEPEPQPREPAGWLDDEPGGGPFDAAAPEEPAEPVAEVEEPPAEPAEPIEHAAEAAEPVPAQEPLAAAEPPPPPAPAEPPLPRASDTPPQGFPAVSRDETDPESDEDVLEETPDFLQDTPEHDRLWFEQKPPRDFDFDD
jgi:hypothetical protein